MSTLGGARVASLVCHVPPAGAWWASVLLAAGVAAPAVGPSTLQVGDLSLVGGVLRADEEAPSQHRAIVVGAPGVWASLARAETWQSDGGVRLRAVLLALQKATGATLTLPTDRSIGPAFGWPMAASRAPSTGSMVLGRLVALGALSTWRVAPAGPVVFTPWPSSVADAKGRLARRNAAVGKRDVKLDARAAAFLPGNTIEGARIARVTYTETADGLRAEVWTS